MSVSALPRLLAAAGLALAVAACQSATTEKTAAAPETAAGLREGPWRAVLAAQGQQVPFLFVVDKDSAGRPIVTLRNGEEKLRLNEVTTAGDSTVVRLGAFDAALVLRPAGDTGLKGAWVKYDAKGPYRVPLTATLGGQQRFLPTDNARAADFGGTWRVTFQDADHAYPAVGVFEQRGNELTGTFLTNTGDYRYLAGQAEGDSLKLSTFDGSHGFLFTAGYQPDGTLRGDFYSGLTGHETWTAIRDDSAHLPDPDGLAAMKPGEQQLKFSFPSIADKSTVISPADPAYRGKVVVVQILGSWCPNCMDETNFLAPWYEKNKGRGVEVIGLGYERSPDYAPAAERLRKMKERLNVGYAVAVAGTSTAAEASKSLPQLSKVLAFPTTIFLDRQGNVRKIHTGFSGPGTGQYYEREKEAFNQTIDKLLAE